jgi:hypothetical protein
LAAERAALDAERHEQQATHAAQLRLLRLLAKQGEELEQTRTQLNERLARFVRIESEGSKKLQQAAGRVMEASKLVLNAEGAGGAETRKRLISGAQSVAGPIAAAEGVPSSALPKINVGTEASTVASSSSSSSGSSSTSLSAPLTKQPTPGGDDKSLRAPGNDVEFVLRTSGFPDGTMLSIGLNDIPVGPGLPKKGYFHFVTSNDWLIRWTKTGFLELFDAREVPPLPGARLLLLSPLIIGPTEIAPKK